MKKIFAYLTILCVFISCKEERKEKAVSVQNIVNDKELLDGWRVFVEDSFKINIPNNWKPEKEDNLLLYVPLNKNKANLYFAIVKTDTSIASTNVYLKEIFRQMSLKDDKFTYLLTKVNLENNTNCYTIDFYSKENNINYKSYCLIYKRGNFIYDFSFKSLNDEKTNVDNYRIFYNALFSFKYKNNLIIDSENFIIKNEEIIKYEDL